MSQQLIMPIHASLITAGYQNSAYHSRFGFLHFGQDYISVTADHRVWGSGNGKVLLAGTDAILGNVMAIQYYDVLNPQTKQCADVVLRYCHLNSIAVKKGDAVTTATQLGVYGNTGKYSVGAHLHVEADYDVRFFAYTATLGKSSNLFMAGSSKTMCCPAQLLCMKRSAPQSQSCIASKATYGGVPYVAASDLPTVCVN